MMSWIKFLLPTGGLPIHNAAGPPGKSTGGFFPDQAWAPAGHIACELRGLGKPHAAMVRETLTLYYWPPRRWCARDNEVCQEATVEPAWRPIGRLYPGSLTNSGSTLRARFCREQVQ